MTNPFLRVVTSNPFTSLLLTSLMVSYWCTNLPVVIVLTLFAGFEVWNKRRPNVPTEAFEKLAGDISRIAADLKTLSNSTSTLSMYLNGNGQMNRR